MSEDPFTPPPPEPDDFSTTRWQTNGGSLRIPMGDKAPSRRRHDARGMTPQDVVNSIAETNAHVLEMRMQMRWTMRSIKWLAISLAGACAVGLFGPALQHLVKIIWPAVAP